MCFLSIWFVQADLMKMNSIFRLYDACWCYWHAWFHLLDVPKFSCLNIDEWILLMLNLTLTRSSTCCVWFVVILMLHNDVPLAMLLIVPVWSCLCDDEHCWWWICYAVIMAGRFLCCCWLQMPMLLYLKPWSFSRNHVSMYAQVWLMLLLVIVWLISMAMLLYRVTWSVDEFDEHMLIKPCCSFETCCMLLFGCIMNISMAMLLYRVTWSVDEFDEHMLLKACPAVLNLINIVPKIHLIVVCCWLLAKCYADCVFVDWFCLDVDWTWVWSCHCICC
jgi:hypothetical protein